MEKINPVSCVPTKADETIFFLRFVTLILKILTIVISNWQSNNKLYLTLASEKSWNCRPTKVHNYYAIYVFSMISDPKMILVCLYDYSCWSTPGKKKKNTNNQKTKSKLYNSVKYLWKAWRTYLDILEKWGVLSTLQESSTGNIVSWQVFSCTVFETHSYVCEVFGIKGIQYTWANVKMEVFLVKGFFQKLYMHFIS